MCQTPPGAAGESVLYGRIDLARSGIDDLSPPAPASFCSSSQHEMLQQKQPINK